MDTRFIIAASLFMLVCLACVWTGVWIGRMYRHHHDRRHHHNGFA